MSIFLICLNNVIC